MRLDVDHDVAVLLNLDLCDASKAAEEGGFVTARSATLTPGASRGDQRGRRWPPADGLRGAPGRSGAASCRPSCRRTGGPAAEGYTDNTCQRATAVGGVGEVLRGKSEGRGESGARHLRAPLALHVAGLEVKGLRGEGWPSARLRSNRRVSSRRSVGTHRAVGGAHDAALLRQLAAEDLALQGGERGGGSAGREQRTQQEGGEDNQQNSIWARARLEREAEVAALVADGVHLPGELLDEHLLRSLKTRAEKVAFRWWFRRFLLVLKT